MKKSKGGRPTHRPEDAKRSQVETMAGLGITEEDIARVIGICPKTLRRHYRAELDSAHIKANAAVAQSLYKKALSDGSQSVTAAIFWLKTRARWKETTVSEVTGADGGALKMEVSWLPPQA